MKRIGIARAAAASLFAFAIAASALADGGVESRMFDLRYADATEVAANFNHTWRGGAAQTNGSWTVCEIAVPFIEANSVMVTAPEPILDVATGTGDFAIQLATTLQPKEVVGADISEGMMEVGRNKVHSAGLDDIIRFAKEDCFKMTFPDSRFDAVTAAFGIRNFSDLDGGLREMCRVLKPGGHLSVIELTTPRHFPMRQLFWLYSHTILPIYGKLVSKDSSAYRYLTATIEAFPQGEEMVNILKRAGFSEARFHRMTFGICTLYFATK